MEISKRIVDLNNINLFPRDFIDIPKDNPKEMISEPITFTPMSSEEEIEISVKLLESILG